MTKIVVSDSGDLLPDSAVAQRYGITPRTIHRWDQRAELGFPKPIRINDRKYRRVTELQVWERTRAAS
jgi:hypothetical protein